MNATELEARKLEERDFHNRLRDEHLKDDPAQYDYLRANYKYYSVTDLSTRYIHNWLRERCAGARVLDYGCGDGQISRFLAKHGAKVTGIDVSDVSVDNCRRMAHAEGLDATFEVMDCENLQFDNGTFNLICEVGVLHHLNLDRALPEMRRVLRPEGQAICCEALAHNPVFRAYRRLTPHLRTAYETEHILTVGDFDRAKAHFSSVHLKFFHLAVLAAMPLQRTLLFEPAKSVLDTVDRALMAVPGLRRMAWLTVAVLSGPRAGAERTK